MNIIAWIDSLDIAVEPERLPEVGEWARFTLDNGDVWKKQFWPEPPALSLSKDLSMTTLGEIFSDDVMLELTDFEMNVGEPSLPQRKCAVRTLNRIRSGVSLDVFGDAFIDMVKEVGRDTSLTPTGATSLIELMQK